MSRVYNAILMVAAVAFSSCATQNYINVSPTAITEKESLVIESNEQFSDVSIVGVGAKAITVEKENIHQSNISEDADELSKIQGVRIDKYKDEQGKEQVKATLEGDLLFAFDSYELSDAAQDILSKFATIIGDDDLEIVGHTDNKGADQYNETLSLNRALSVKMYFKQVGFNGEIKTFGRGELIPLNDNSSAEKQVQNRRVEIFVVKKDK